MEICGKVSAGHGRVTQRLAPAIALRACSACAGDYEDPDRTAWSPDGEDLDSEETGQERDGSDAGRTAADVEDANNGEFPATES